MTEATETALTTVFRDEWPRLISAALRITGDLQAAEDAAQETLLAALDRWPLQGVPARPGAWLMTACRNRARNVVRDDRRARQRIASLRPLLNGRPPPAQAPDGEAPGVIDDRLRLIAMCCHSLLSADAQVALTLRMVAGLTNAEIARGFNVPTATIAQRIVRAKRTLSEQRAAFAADDPDIRTCLASILDVIYLIFNEGYLSTEGELLVRGDLAFEAHRLASLLTSLLPAEPDPWALRSLLSFQLSRWSTRSAPDGTPLTLDSQDRSRWDRELVGDGVSSLQRARRGGRCSLLLLQAELAACHATAPSYAATHWASIVALYDELLSIQDTPVVALNRAVAVAVAAGPIAGLPELNRLARDPVLARSHRVWAVRADVQRRAGHTAAAIADHDRAIKLAGNEAERGFLPAPDEKQRRP